MKEYYNKLAVSDRKVVIRNRKVTDRRKMKTFIMDDRRSGKDRRRK